MGIEAVISVILNGVFTGGVYGLVSSAFTFQAGALRVINFSYGSATMLAMYLTFFTVTMCHLPMLFAIPLIIAAFFLLGILVRITALSTPHHGAQILCTMGVELITINLVLFLFTGFPRDMAILEKRLFITDTISVGWIQIICFVMAALILAGFQLFLNKTWAGMAIRAVVEREEVAGLMGLNSRRIMHFAFAVSYVIIALAGVMLMTLFQAEPNFGNYIMLIAFLVCIVAGLGNMVGSFFSGIIVGVISSLITLILGAKFHDLVLFALFILILLVRPNGLFASIKKPAAQI
jgi:branched-chain amino acid transport system permease protein